MGQGTRQQRVANAMRELLTELIAREVKDPRVHAAGMVSVSQVDLNRDLSVARVYVSFIGGAGDEQAEERALAALQAAAGFLRGPVGRRMRLQRAPELRFWRDSRAEFGQRMREILIEDEQRAPVASSPADAEPAGEPAPGPDEPDDGGSDDPDDDGQDRDDRGS
ncbi:MAG TPA: 30S ribosome-binding factor RbfA [Haliangium sp.]|nr:30S ribosome-binding factor RbfA [Haliangium sp.]